MSNTKITVGDKITVETLYCTVADVLTHTPTPWVPKIDDRVRFKVAPSACTFKGHGKVLHFYNDRVWVKWDDLSVPTSPLIAHLELAE